MTEQETIIAEIKAHVILFKEWLLKNYSQEEIAKELYDDTGYPNWNDIEDTFEIAFKYLNFKDLNGNELENISYLLARQWDVGIIFPFFKKEISFIGMTEEQLIVLAEYGVKSKEWSFRQQCAASLFKLKQNKKVAQTIAYKYLKDEDVDIRRHALASLKKLKYAQLSNGRKISPSFRNNIS